MDKCRKKLPGQSKVLQPPMKSLSHLSYCFSDGAHLQLHCNIALTPLGNHYTLLMGEKYKYLSDVNNQLKLALNRYSFPITPTRMSYESSSTTYLFPRESYFFGQLTMSMTSHFHFYLEEPYLLEGFGKLANFDYKVCNHIEKSIDCT